MSRGSALPLWLLLVLPVIGSGCAMMDSGRNWLTGQRTDQTEPEIAEDKWAFVGKEARGGRTTEKEDPLDHWLWSEKARDINRNFNVE